MRSARAHERGTHRRAEPLAEADRHGVEVLAPVAGCDLRRRHGVPDPRHRGVWPVPFSCAHVPIEAIVSSGYTVPPPRLCVFSRQTRRVRTAWTSSGRIVSSKSASSSRPKRPSRVRQVTPLSAGGSAGFPQGNVAGGFEQDLVLRPAVYPHGNLVRHGPGRNEQPGLLAKHRRDAAFQLVDRGVFPENVVTHGGRGHGREHSGRGFGQRVAA